MSLLIDFIANRYDIYGIFRNDAVPLNLLLDELGLDELYKGGILLEAHLSPVVQLVSLLLLLCDIIEHLLHAFINAY